MDCTNSLILLNGLLDEIISDDDKALLYEHLSTCKSCKTYYENLKALKNESSKLSCPKLPENFEDRILAAVKNHRFIPSVNKRNIRRYVLDMRFISGLAAVIVVAITIKFMGIHNTANLIINDNIPSTSIGLLDSDDSKKIKDDVSESLEVSESKAPEETNSQGLNTGNKEAEGAQQNSAVPKKMIEEPTNTSSFNTKRENNTSTENSTPSTMSDDKFAGEGNTAVADSGMAMTMRTLEPVESAGSEPVGGSKSSTNSLRTPPVNTPALSVDTARIGSLVKRKITFTITSENQAEKAIAIYNANSSSVSGIRNALSNANILYTERETISEDYTVKYNTLADQAAELKNKIQSSTDNSTIEKYSSQIYSLKSQMDALKAECAKVQTAISAAK